MAVELAASSARSAIAMLTAGLKCAPETEPNVRIKTVSVEIARGTSAFQGYASVVKAIRRPDLFVSPSGGLRRDLKIPRL
jgi:hypothetical protein